MSTTDPSGAQAPNGNDRLERRSWYELFTATGNGDFDAGAITRLATILLNGEHPPERWQREAEKFMHELTATLVENENLEEPAASVRAQSIARQAWFEADERLREQHAQQQSGVADDPASVPALLAKAGVAGLREGAPDMAVEKALRTLADLLQGAGVDALRRATVRAAVITKLAEIKKPAAARIADAMLSLCGGNGADSNQVQGSVLELADPEPWPDPVYGAELLDEIAGTFRAYLVLPKMAAEALALWVVHTYAAVPTFDSPYINIKSATKQCGKSRTVEVSAGLARRPLMTAMLTPATIFRTIEGFHPTLLIDEADSTEAMGEELRALLNAGNRHGVKVPRCVGDSQEIRLFDVFCPKMIAGIGRLADTTEDRSIVITLKRRTPDEPVERFRRDRVYAACDPLRRRAARWAADHLDALRDSDPELPSALSDRGQDKWRALVAIADLAGGPWPALARTAALTLSALGAVADQNVGIMLLADLRDLFTERGKKALPSETIISHLVKIESRPWPEWRHGKALTAVQLARLLKPFDVHPKTVRIGDDTPKGYDLADLRDAFDRYLGAIDTHTWADSDDSSRHTATDVAAHVETSLFDPQQERSCGGSQNTTLPMREKACGAVADENEKYGAYAPIEDDTDPEDVSVYLHADGSRWTEVIEGDEVVWRRVEGPGAADR